MIHEYIYMMQYCHQSSRLGVSRNGWPFSIDMDYKDPRWIRKRNRILRRDKYQCQMSKRYGKLRQAEVVHHIFPVADYPQYQWEDWNLISITQDWHNKFHDRNTNKLTAVGLELLRKTARRQGIEI